MLINCQKIFGDERAMRKEITITLTTMLAIGLLSMLMTTAPVSAAKRPPTLGWDFECHTNTHANLKGSSEAVIRAELEAVDAAFIAHGYPVPQHTAYPYGNYDLTVEAIVSQYRKTGRTVSGNMETYPVPNWYELKCYGLKRNTRFSTLQKYVDQCIATNALLHIFTHDVADKPSTWGAKLTVLIQLLNYLATQQTAGKLKVMTMTEAYDVWSTATTNPGATVVVSFDDAYETDFTTVYPLFQARGLKGTSYIDTAAIETTGHLTWAEIAQMAAGL
jgi:peptidoglycan/xylan/chitin deacetylase (PgdA/CDA1 family)